MHHWLIPVAQIASPICAAIGVIIAVWNAQKSIRATTENAQRSGEGSRKIAQRRATLDLIVLEQTNSKLFKKRREFLRLRQEGDLIRWASPENAASEAVSHISAVMNKYEMVALGIENEALCEIVYKDWLKTTFVKDWVELQGYVYELRRRHNNPHLYERFERLAKKWQGENC
ncbi:DUF4760 domain-containing protein [Gluconobacter cerinus]|uniref:DUF4760 domain-containing protein n=1 Tax=Gluconobacter cerinus TaxID=38307 RepID=UPI001C04E26E|nr:DUF4760 domain-containing protein [Gluconobacter cerinus]